MLDWVIKYWVEVVFGAIISGFGLGFKQMCDKVKTQQEKQKSVELGMQALLRNSIVRNYFDCMDKGYCSQYMMENVFMMYEQYKNLGGNSFVTQIVEEMKRMPKRKKDIDK